MTILGEQMNCLVRVRKESLDNSNDDLPNKTLTMG